MSLFRHCTSFGPLVTETTTREDRQAMADRACANYYATDIALTSSHEVKSQYVGMRDGFEMWDSVITFGGPKVKHFAHVVEYFDDVMLDRFIDATAGSDTDSFIDYTAMDAAKGHRDHYKSMV
jgi:hypothetical protein